MSLQEAERRIVECRKTKNPTLALRNLKLTEVPVSICELTHLTNLDLSFNLLSSLPDFISELSNLQILNLCGNRLSLLPHAISQLSNLTELDFSFNQLNSLPEVITQLSNLTVLDLSDNQLNSLPESITQLTILMVLDLRGNRLSSLPEVITQLSNLTVLYISDNQMSALPEAITQLPNLQRLDLDNNLLTDPPLELAVRGIDAIRAYFAERAAAPDDIGLYEAKLLLVGEGRVGKTSLSKSLRIPNYQLEDEQSTEGIDIQTWTIPAAETGLDEDFRLNVWDFGGQEIYHATHQFFLTRRSLYLLVTESRREDKHDDFYY